MLIKLEEVAHFPFSLRDPSTGNVAVGTINSVTAYEEDGLTPLTTDASVVTLTATGQYVAKVTCTAASGFEVGKTYSVRVNATVGDVTDESQVGSFQVSVENHGVAIDKTMASIETNIIGRGDAAWLTAVGFAEPGDVPTVAQIWAETFYGIAASNLITFAAVGAGIGKVDIGGHTPGATRVETFRLPDDSADAFEVTVDAEGERTLVSLLP